MASSSHFVISLCIYNHVLVASCTSRCILKQFPSASEAIKAKSFKGANASSKAKRLSSLQRRNSGIPRRSRTLMSDRSSAAEGKLFLIWSKEIRHVIRTEFGTLGSLRRSPMSANSIFSFCWQYCKYFAIVILVFRTPI